MKVVFTFIIALFLIFSCSEENSTDLIDNGGQPPIVDNDLNNKPTGEAANDLLSNTVYSKLIVEIVYIDNFKPTTTAINNFKSFLQNRLNKSNIEIIQRSIGAATKNTYTLADIINIEKDNRQKFTNNQEIAVFAFFANGEYSENTSNSKVLGAAYKNTSFVLFEETIQSFSTGLFAPELSVLETVVLNHEFGHILGLVNLGSTMQNNHQDTAHGKHCDNEDCLMFWTAETGEGLVDMLSGGSVPNLDANCIADLQANGGK